MRNASAFSPVAALSSGLSSPKFDPGDAIHLSLGGDRLIGEHSLSIAAVADVYTDDKLVASGTDAARASSSAQRSAWTRRFTSRHDRSRIRRSICPIDCAGSFSRDGQTVDGSSAELSGGRRTRRRADDSIRRLHRGGRRLEPLGHHGRQFARHCRNDERERDGGIGSPLRRILVPTLRPRAAWHDRHRHAAGVGVRILLGTTLVKRF